MNKKTKLALIFGGAALVLVAGLIVLLLLWPFGTEGEGDTLAEYVSLESTVDENNIVSVQVPTEADGTAKEAISGTIIDVLPAQLNKITVENQGGSYSFDVVTNSSGETTYTLVGFEGYALDGTTPALMGSAVSSLEMAGIVDLTGEKASEYGFDSPRAVVTSQFKDGTTTIIYIGDDAPGGEYTNIRYGNTPTIFSVLKTDIEPLLSNLNDLFDDSIRSDYTTFSDESFDAITLGGSKLKDELVIEHGDGSLASYYVLSSHGKTPVNTDIGSGIVGSIKSLQTDGVAYVNPSASQLASLGLDKPYATVKTTYSNTDADTSEVTTLKVSMLCSKPDADGNVYLMNEGDKVVYIMKAESLTWATATLDDMRSEYVFAPAYTALKSVTFTVGSETYKYNLETVVVDSVDAEGNDTSTTSTTVTLDGKAVSEAYFRVLFDDLALMKNRGKATSAESDGEKLVNVTYEYSTGRAADKVEFYGSASQKVIPSVNGSMDCYAYKAEIDGIIKNAKALAQGKEITSIAG